MTFASVLPHLAAGRRVRRVSWPEFGYIGKTPEADRWLFTCDLLATDWELVEEPRTVTAAPHVCAGSCQSAIDADATITRLTHDLEHARQSIVDEQKKRLRAESEMESERRACGELGASNLRLTRELAETRKTLQLVQGLVK